jgi:glycosyltransferase involved in cell wall biosynthesis
VVSYLNAEKGLKDNIAHKAKYITIHSSINLDDFSRPSCDIPALKKHLGIRPDSLLIGTVGRLSPQKNPSDFVRVAAEVKKEIPQTQFVFIGDGLLRAETERLIKELSLSKDVFLPGLRKDVPQLLQCMDVFILTSLWEGLPRVIPQAMAAGLPVVANAVDGVCEVIKEGDNGFLIPPGDVSLMSKRLTQILSDAGLRHRMGRAGRSTAEKEFSLCSMINSLESLYEELLTKKAVQV